MRKAVEKIMKPMLRRIYLMLGRAVLTALNDSNGRQYVQFEALKGEVKDKVERLQNYGFSSNPLSGAQVLFGCIGGNRDHPLAIVVDDPRYRPKGKKPGETIMYSHTGNYIIIKNDGSIEISADTLLVKAASKVRFETPILECTGDIVDRVDLDGRSMGAMRDKYNTHKHHENDGGGNTDQPNAGDLM